MSDHRPSRSGAAGPMLALVLVVGLGLLAWWLFPIVQSAVSRQDCIASGRVTGC